MAVVIGVDPHKGSHTAVAIDGDEVQLAAVTVRATRRQVSELLSGRDGSRSGRGRSSLRVGSVISLPVNSSRRVSGCWMCRRRWRRGCGCWARAGRTRTIPTMRCRSRSRRCARLGWLGSAADEHSGVLRLFAKRNRDLGRARNRTACRLHALLAELVPGGISKEINARSAERLLATVEPLSPVQQARHDLALEHLEDLRRFDKQMRASKQRIAAAVTAVGDHRDRDLRCGTRRRRDGDRLHRRRHPVREP